MINLGLGINTNQYQPEVENNQNNNNIQNPINEQNNLNNNNINNINNDNLNTINKKEDELIKNMPTNNEINVDYKIENTSNTENFENNNKIIILLRI